jgi:hypothetical protein
MSSGGSCPVRGAEMVFGEDAATPPTVHWRDPLQAHDEDTEHLMEQL